MTAPTEAEVVRYDTVRGHIRVGDLVFADTCNVLHVWAYTGCVLTPDTARDLAAALNDWGTRRADVHNHGPEEGPGLACNERVRGGVRLGACMCLCGRPAERWGVCGACEADARAEADQR